MKNVGKNEFTPSKDLINTSGAQECMGRGVDEKICKNVYFLLFGYDTKYFNMVSKSFMFEKEEINISLFIDYCWLGKCVRSRWRFHQTIAALR